MNQRDGLLPIVRGRVPWLVLLVALVGSLAVIGLGSATSERTSESAPAGSESRRAAEIAAGLPGSDLAPVLLLAHREEGLTDADLAFLSGAAERVALEVRSDPGRPAVSSDGEAVMLPIMMSAELPSQELAEAVTGVREAARSEPVPEGLEFFVTGGPAFGADTVLAFEGADVTLLVVTIGIVAVLLLVTYRSPILSLVPLAVVALADQAATVVSTRVASALDLQLDGGIVSVLVFGAGTNYALLMVSRYREELRREADHRVALSRAWRGSMPAILASNLTVVVALLSLLLAEQPASRGLSVTSAAGLLIALAFVTLALPAALALGGRGVFWPFVPRVGDGAGGATSGPWHAVARSVARRPVSVLVVSLLVLGFLATGLVGTRVGLAQDEQFRVPSESGAGLALLSEHFPPGESAPLSLVVPAAETGKVLAAVEGVDGVLRVHPVGEASDSWQRVSAVLEAAPGTERAGELVATVRAAVRDVSPETLVGGPMAEDLDAAEAARGDLFTVVPLVLLVSLVVLAALMRSVVAPVVLLLVNALSAVAAIGAGAWLGREWFGFPALDLLVPLLGFLFLVALGIDYTIFLVHRARQEARVHGTVDGMVRAIGATGVVITSAGVVLAAVFAALGVLPLVTLGQLGVIVGLGVLLDTLLVRTVVVPAVFALVGDAMWWPGSLRRVPRPTQDALAAAAPAARE